MKKKKTRDGKTYVPDEKKKINPLPNKQQEKNMKKNNTKKINPKQIHITVKSHGCVKLIISFCSIFMFILVFFSSWFGFVFFAHCFFFLGQLNMFISAKAKYNTKQNRVKWISVHAYMYIIDWNNEVYMSHTHTDRMELHPIEKWTKKKNNIKINTQQHTLQIYFDKSDNRVHNNYSIFFYFSFFRLYRHGFSYLSFHSKDMFNLFFFFFLKK